MDKKNRVRLTLFEEKRANKWNEMISKWRLDRFTVLSALWSHCHQKPLYVKSGCLTTVDWLFQTRTPAAQKAHRPKFHLLRHFTTRHYTLSSPYILVQVKSYVLRRPCYTASVTQHVEMSAAGAIRNFVCNVYKVMIAVILFNKRINFIFELK